jgi:hypothetical protein
MIFYLSIETTEYACKYSNFLSYLQQMYTFLKVITAQISPQIEL